MLKRVVVWLLAMLAIVVLFWGGWHLGGYVEERHQHDAEMSAVRSAANMDTVTLTGADLASLRRENPDCIGWISIEGTELDYPVMHTPEKPEYYLKRSFSGEGSPYGVPFLDARCSLSSDNLIIYGHHMSDGSMFSVLHDYRDQDFLEAHPVIRFETLDGVTEYQVAAVMQVRGTLSEGDKSIYNQIDIGVEQWGTLADELRTNSLFNTGKIPDHKNHLLTLSTCEYSQEDGRLVVVAMCE